ncbi:unnamed protein product, partial [Rotaria sp. Silwood1]
MFPGFIQGALLAVVIILTQTTKRIHCDDTSSNVDDSHVLLLTKDTFDDALKSNKHLFVKFVAPWCDHCKALSPAYAAAAKQLVDFGINIKLASVDGTIEHDLAQKYDVKVYPTIKFFSNSTTFDYTGGRAPDDIISWLKKKTGPAAEELKTIDDLKKLKEANEVVVIGAFKDTDGDAATSFLQVAETIDRIPFGITSNQDVLKELDIKQDTIVLLKKFDEGRNDLTATIDEGSIREFIQANQLPIVVDFNAEVRENYTSRTFVVHDYGGKALSKSMSKVLSPQWPGEPNGPGYHNFKNPNSLQSRYFNLYNTISENLSDFIGDQEPVVFVSSMTTGFRVYKSNGTYINLTGYSNYGALYFGYTNDHGGGRRGPGSENFIVSSTSEMTLYGMGALRNNFVNFTPAYLSVRSMQDIEKEISKFIKYTGIFGNSAAYDDTSECASGCFAANPGAVSDLVDWTKAPNSYIFTGKDKNGSEVDGLYIPVKKAYEMWSKGGEFMKSENGNYTPIPSGTAKAGLYWEDEPGLIKCITLEGTGENAKIKVLVNKLKEGNAVVSYRVNDKVYWTWHVWVTDDPTANGSTYRLGFEKDKNGNPVTEWKWMDRNLGATSANFLGNNWHKSQGLQYQWGRKDPFPALTHKDGTLYEISGEIGNIRHVGAVYKTGSTSALPVKYRGNLYPQDNTGFDTPNGNIRYSVQNPIHMIIPPLYVKKYNETVNNNGEDMFVQNSGNTWYHQRRTTWFSKQKYRNEFSTDPSKNVAWDLWGDTRGGKISDLNNPQLAEESKRYAMKSPYDPCPCNWRVPSYYDNIGSHSNDNNASPWGRIGGANDVDTFTSNPSTSSTRFPGIKIYPGLGYDFTGVADRNLGLIPINGNYEYYPNYVTIKSINTSGLVTPKMFYQDGSSDGALGSSTFSVGAAGGGPWYGPRGLGYVSDPGNVQETANNFGWYTMNSVSHDGNTHETGGIRCIKDPNNAYMPTAFATEFISSPNEEYALSTLISWTKDPNSYVEYTNSSVTTASPADKDRVIDIPLRKAYAMYKLHLSTTEEYPQGNIKSGSVVWTTNTGLIQNMEIIDGTKETAKLRVTLNENQYGNAVAAFHLGNSGQWANGKMQDPIIWSWHVWAPETMIGSLDYETETSENGGIINGSNTAFVNPVKSIAVPLKTTFMDRDLGALMMFPEEASAGSASYIYSFIPQISKSGGLHFQWGRKDPLPVLINAGGHYDFGTAVGSQGSIYKNMTRYTIRIQSGPISDGMIPYSGIIDSTSYTTNYAKEFSTDYSSIFSSADSKKDKIKKVLMYSVNNPLYFLYQNPSNETDRFKKVRDWLSDENGQFTDRWGHGTEKSPFDPCPEGWRVPDTFSS